MKSFLLPGFLFIIFSASKAQVELIPRVDFFTGEQRMDFRMDDGAQKLYFRNDRNPQALYFLKVNKPAVIDSIMLPAAIRTYLPVKDGYLAIVYDQAYNILLNGDQIDLPFTANRIRIISKVQQQSKVALWVETGNTDQDGIYVFDINDKSMEYKHALPDLDEVFLDASFNMIAGHVQGDEGGSRLLYHREGEWMEFENHPWFIDQFFIGGFSKIVSVTANGESIYYTSNNQSDKTNLYRINPQSGSPELIVRGVETDILPIGASTNDYGEVTSVVGVAARTFRYCLNPEAEMDFEWLDENIKGDISFAQSLDHDTQWLIREFTGGPAKMYLFNRSERKLTYLTNDYPALNNEPLASRKAFMVKSADGLNLPVHVYLPPGSDKNNDGIPDQPLPTIFYVHGGPWVGIFHWNQYFHWRNFQLLANRGYAVVNCEFRGSSGMGKEFATKSMKDWGKQMLKDKIDLADWAVSKEIAIKDKRAVWGWSYGGYATLEALAQYPNTFACGISMYGISDLESFIKTDFANNDFWKSWVGDPFDSTEASNLRSVSPLQHVNKIMSPVYLSTGGKDERVPHSQVDDMANALDKAGKEVLYLYYPEEPHDYRLAESWISFWAVGEQFLKENLGGNAEAIKADLDKGQVEIQYGKKKINEWKKADAGNHR